MALSALAACGGAKAEPVAPASTSSAPPAASAEPPPAPSSAPAEAATEPHRKKHRPYEITNHCADVVTIVFGDEPKTAPRGKRTIAANDTIEGPRGEDGTETIWLVDDKGEPILNVHVTRGIKKVQIGRSCRTLDAR
ncbi:MAG: hypothetical protein KC657_34210 [Myxococcales bacterium]|nr:hypothetical protein [Myxococcales bacterium]